MEFPGGTEVEDPVLSLHGVGWIPGKEFCVLQVGTTAPKNKGLFGCRSVGWFLRTQGSWGSRPQNCRLSQVPGATSVRSPEGSLMKKS